MSVEPPDLCIEVSLAFPRSPSAAAQYDYARFQTLLLGGLRWAPTTPGQVFGTSL